MLMDVLLHQNLQALADCSFAFYSWVLLITVRGSTGLKLDCLLIQAETKPNV